MPSDAMEKVRFLPFADLIERLLPTQSGQSSSNSQHPDIQDDSRPEDGWRQDRFIRKKALGEPHQRRENGSLQHHRSDTAKLAPRPPKEWVAFVPCAVPPNADSVTT